MMLLKEVFTNPCSFFLPSEVLMKLDPRSLANNLRHMVDYVVFDIADNRKPPKSPLTPITSLNQDPPSPCNALERAVSYYSYVIMSFAMFITLSFRILI